MNAAIGFAVLIVCLIVGLIASGKLLDWIGRFEDGPHEDD